MSIQPVWQGTFSFFHNLPIVVESSRTQLSSAAGLLPIRQFDEAIGLTRQFAHVLDDPRRGDAGYGMPWMYAVSERLQIDYTYGLSANKVLQEEISTGTQLEVRRAKAMVF